MSNTGLRDRRILVVEDECVLAENLRYELEDAGAVVIGPSGSVEHALALIAATPVIDAVALDANLRGEAAYPIADALRARRVPFVLTTGYSAEALDGRYPDAPYCEKPFGFTKLAKALSLVLSAGA